MLPVSLSTVFGAQAQAHGKLALLGLSRLCQISLYNLLHTQAQIFFRQMLFSQKNLFMSFLFLFMCVYTWHTYGGRGKCGMNWFPSSAMWGQPLLSVFLFLFFFLELQNSGTLRYASFQSIKFLFLNQASGTHRLAFLWSFPKQPLGGSETLNFQPPGQTACFFGANPSLREWRLFKALDLAQQQGQVWQITVSRKQQAVWRQ